MRLLLSTVFFMILSNGLQASGLMVKPFSSMGDLTLTLSPLAPDSSAATAATSQEYSPNINSYSGVTLGFNNFSITYGNQIPVSAAEKITKGTTKFSDYQMQLFYKKVGVDLYYQVFKGFYRSSATSTEKTTLADGTEIFPLLPNMEMKKFGASIYYLFSPKNYSMIASFSQTKKQNKSGGSFILMGTLNDINISNGGSPLLPLAQQSIFGTDGGITGARMKSGGLSIGGGYTLLWGNLFLSAQALIGKAYQQFKGNGTADSTTQNSSADLFNIKASLGYRLQHLFFGIMGFSDRVTTQTDSIEIIPESTLGTLYIGWQF